MSRKICIIKWNNVLLCKNLVLLQEMFNEQNRLMDFNVTEEKIVNDMVSGPLWKNLGKTTICTVLVLYPRWTSQLSEKIIKKYYSYLCASFFTFTDYRQNNRFNADANLKIQWSSSERDRKDTWKKCKKLYASHHPVYSGK